ncbi:caspase-2-like [Macrobrachium nipponense]|uniref:caspase-2-like n=1 Tax=Macrobrachium nipponense TaxID=159736 RepID=UPI0030C7A93C
MRVKGYTIGEDQTRGPLRIKVKARTSGIVENDVYPMNPDSRGYVCILSFGSFERRPDLKLEASEDDASNLANVFNQMGYSGEVHHSLTSNETKETLTRIREMKELWDAVSATFIISSHATSDNDAFFASDMQQLSTEWLLGFFSDAKCPQLKNKPKLFIFDLCRGYYTDSWTSVPRFLF